MARNGLLTSVITAAALLHQLPAQANDVPRPQAYGFYVAQWLHDTDGGSPGVGLKPGARGSFAHHAPPPAVSDAARSGRSSNGLVSKGGWDISGRIDTSHSLAPLERDESTPLGMRLPGQPLPTGKFNLELQYSF